MHVPREVEFLQDGDDGRMQPIHVFLDVQAQEIERKSEVGNDLPRQVEDASSSAIHVMDLDAHRMQEVVIRHDMGTTARSADADRGRVLAQDQ